MKNEDIEVRLSTLEFFAAAVAARVSADSGHSFEPFLAALRDVLPSHLLSAGAEVDVQEALAYQERFVKSLDALQSTYSMMLKRATSGRTKRPVKMRTRMARLTTLHP